MIMINTKRIFTALLFAIIAVAGYAYDFVVDGIYYNLDNDGNAVVTYGDKKYSGKIEIPNYVKIKGKQRTVVGIGKKAFQNCEDLTSVNEAYDVTYIDDYAFDKCHNLTYVNLPRVTSIGRYAFYNCKSLEPIYLPGKLKNIGESAFEGCSSLTEVSIPQAVTEIPYCAFAYCEKLKVVKLYGQVTSIGDGAFMHCPALWDFYCYADNVPQMGEDVFRSSGVDRAYLNVPEGKTDEYTNDETWGEFGIIIEVNEVKRDGFWYRLDYGASTATLINNPDEYRYTIEYDGDINITSQITVDNNKYSVVAIGDYAFAKCKIKSVSIPETVTKIGKDAFEFSTLESLVIPNSVTEIGEFLIGFCNNLKSLVLPNSLEKLPTGMAWECQNLQWVNIPSTVTTIERQAFGYCKSLESIIIPSSVTEIGWYAFCGCTSMTDVYCQAVNVPITEKDIFDKTPIENMTLYVPSESMNAYKTTDPWSGFGNIKALTTGIEKTKIVEKPVITTMDGQISVSGLSGNATVQLVSLDGKLLDSENATDGIATLKALSGEVVIVKVGTESFKVVVK